MGVSSTMLVARERRSDIQAHCEVSVVVPTYNEAENVRELIPRLSHALRGISHELVIVDGKSIKKC